MQRKLMKEIISAILADETQEVRRLIVENNVDINVRITVQKVTLLMIAAKAGSINALKTLLELGASKSIAMVDYIGRTATDYALKYGSFRMYLALVTEEVKQNSKFYYM